MVLLSSRNAGKPGLYTSASLRTKPGRLERPRRRIAQNIAMVLGIHDIVTNTSQFIRRIRSLSRLWRGGSPEGMYSDLNQG
jgi:hypothetical protein